MERGKRSMNPMDIDIRIDAPHATTKGDANHELLQAYLIDLRGHRLLSGDEQMSIARSAREHRTQYRQTLLSTGFAQRRFLSILVASQDKRRSIQDVCETSFRDLVQHQIIRRHISETVELLQANLSSNDRAMDSILCDDVPAARRRKLAAGIVQRLDACRRLLHRIPFRPQHFDEVYGEAVALSQAMVERLRTIRSVARRDRPAAEPTIHELRFMIRDSLATPGQLAARLQVAKHHKAESEEHVCELARANLRLVVKVAKQYRNRGLSFLDLIQEGNAGLMKCLGRFDERVGCRVSTYAMWWIRQSIIRALHQHSRLVRLPLAAGHLAAQFSAESDRIYTETGSRPSVECLARRAGVATHVAEAILRATERPLSLAVPLADEEAATGFDILEDERELDAAHVMELSEYLQNAIDGLNRLSERERTLLRLRYGLEDGRFRSFRQLSETFSLTPQRLQQIEQRALEKLRRMLQHGHGD